MKRNVDMKDISDGKLYDLNDMVKADCNDCKGCSACCRGMGESIQLDPLDIYNLTIGLNTTFEQLLAGAIELNVVDGVILPNLNMNNTKESCHFLNEEGRCTVHAFRPGICRLFPLGRYYENGSFQYFLQTHECKNENRTKVKVKKWIDTPDVKRYDSYINQWHYFLKDLQQIAAEDEEGTAAKTISMYVLKQFYLTPFQAEADFYGQFERRMMQACDVFGIRPQHS